MTVQDRAIITAAEMGKGLRQRGLTLWVKLFMVQGWICCSGNVRFGIDIITPAESAGHSGKTHLFTPKVSNTVYFFNVFRACKCILNK